MPPQIFTCVVCGEEVSKRKSYVFGVEAEGNTQRACKKHEEVQEHHEQQVKKEQEEKEAKAKAEKNRWKKHRQDTPTTLDGNLVCWSCDCEGRDVREFFLRMAVNMEKVHLMKKAESIFEMNEKTIKATQADMGDKKPLWLVDLSERSAKQIKSIVRGYHRRMAAEFGKAAWLCADCKQKHGFKDEIPEFKDMDLEKMLLVGSLAKEAIGKIARQEMTRDSMEN